MISAYSRFPFKISEIRLNQAVQDLYDKADLEVKSISKSILCKSGCSYCCHQEVMIQAAEGPIIESNILKFDSKLKNEISQNFRKWFTVENRSMLPYKTPCPLLIDSKCSIYPVRPLVCRLHVIVDSVHLCEISPARSGYLSYEQYQKKYFDILEKISGVPAFQLFPFPVAEAFGVLDAPMPTFTQESFLKSYKKHTIWTTITSLFKFRRK